ncbi:aminotransferase class I/II-fold pyridoxal phosphate-dependent enzyme [Clostridium botulinum]|uniref:aminotransferase class I/II-fold pyridoxal phosphate-dependent enzyme n=1 Tax=Clostridium botulinum TaxID=1491 RepID=UPI0013F0C58E|nr:aminotransferase class I/II-fold pyridoxal phosphate-dependent enzyme [Clostridium botulinum]NFG24704.1 aminotransferase class I/II-fold pyridoxal phosphate-dependent enzyme [Clostridium botulinum]NFR15362.1 aminotransferase class I/II-fold pyridoxal phosphate-dependent enzyme [Clostridium botulinum]NFR43307.1 aminotransferase class I/II-fold pyridoxal phosphate-dependent enzyme [Clostridium botulinum]NFS50687.1 aminotransferase class I/II-fold pyridoxal phosphate-dependent enzyme [Clostridi
MILENMIKKNVREMPPSGIRKYFDMINEMEGVISLGVGEPDFVTPWNVREAGIYSLEKGHTHYSSNAGFIELRHEISKYLYRRFNLSYNPTDEIIVTVGGSEGIDIALRALVGPGDEVIIPEPSFVAYKGCTTFTGATPKVINLRAEDEFKLTPELLEKAITPKTKVVIIPFPNNPTGAIMTREELTKIVEVLKDKDIIVISDEIYAELCYDEEHVSIASFPEMRDKTLVINGFSKAYAMTGWRLGYLCGHPTLIDAMKKIHQYAIMCSPTTAQYAAIEAMKNGDKNVQTMVREYNRRRRVLVDGFRKMGLDCFEPLGAFYVFPSIKSTGMTSDEFCEQLLINEKVLTVPGNAFGDCGEGFIRACYASSMDNIMEALKRIERFIEKINK